MAGMVRTLTRRGAENHFPTYNHIGYLIGMEVTGIAIRRLQRSLNALGRGLGMPRLKVDGRLGRRTVSALARLLAAGGAKAEEALVRALRALD